MTDASSRGEFGATAIAAVQVISEADEDAMSSLLMIWERDFVASMCFDASIYQRAISKWRVLDDIFQFPIWKSIIALSSLDRWKTASEEEKLPD